MGFFDIDRPSKAYDPRLGVKFSKEEIRSISIAVIVLTISFAFVFTANGIGDILNRIGNRSFYTSLGVNLISSFFAVLTAFVLHEIGHKIAANHYGYPASFSYSRNGLLTAAFVSIFLGFLFAAPGAVMIYGYPSKKENGIISLAGPLTNLAIAALAFILFIIGIVLSAILGFPGIILTILWVVFSINIIIGAFNLIPIGVLDGAKILKWNKIVYALMVIVFIPAVLFVFLFRFLTIG